MNVPVYGLVMAGGLSRRMGRDKARIDYHGIPQAVWTARLLEEACSRVFVSCREDQDLGFTERDDLHRIHDIEPNLGPIGGFISAHRAHPQAAWIAVGCDLPRLTAGTLRFLIAQRDAGKLCTAYRSVLGGLPEPLCALYEPAIMQVFEEALARDLRCPRRILIDQEHQVKLIDLPGPDALDNVNTPEEASDFRRDCQ